MKARMRVYHRRTVPRLRILITALLFFALVSLYFLDHAVRPVFLTAAELKLHAAASNTIAQAIRDVVAGGVGYRDLIAVQTDTAGRIVMMQPNTTAVNQLMADANRKVQEKVDELAHTTIGIPLGQALGSFIFAASGPTIPVRCQPLGSATTSIIDKFESAGINQTRHSLWLEVKVRIRVVIPLAGSAMDIATQVPLTEAVLVGEVPSTYIQIQGAGGGIPRPPSGP